LTPKGFRPPSPQHIKDISDGLGRPDGRVASAILAAYPDLGAEMYALMGMPSPPSPPPSPIPDVPPGAKWLTEDDTPIPLGPRAAADDSIGLGDVPGEQEMVNFGKELLDAGGNYAIRVTGDCLEPMIQTGDTVVVQLAADAPSGKVVVIRLKEDLGRGELGDGYSLKVYQPKGAKGAGYYRADGSMAFHETEAQIVGRVVRIISGQEPQWTIKRAKAATYQHYKDRY
jgi:hypothetical protein